MNLIEQAQMFATQKHVWDNKQPYGSLLPYTHHTEKVAEVLISFGFSDEVIQAAARLHDVVEDTRGRKNEVRVRDIEELFGEDVSFLVDAVTTPEGANRKIRNALAYPRIREAGTRAIALKLADRIANVGFGGRARGMYKEEQADFMHALYNSTSGLDPMWAKLQSLFVGLD